MFAYCDSLKYLNIASFDTSKVSDMIEMFDGTRNLNLLILSNKFYLRNEVKISNECMEIEENGANIAVEIKIIKILKKMKKKMKIIFIIVIIV